MTERSYRDFTVLRRQRSEVADILENVGLPPVEFSWSNETGRFDNTLTVSRLVHVPTGYFFTFDFIGYENNHYAICSPGAGAVPVGDYGTGDWPHQRTAVAEWAARLRAEVETPDPDARFFSAANLIQEGEQRYADNAPFGEAEYRDIVRRLETIRAYLLVQAGEDEEARRVTDAKIDHLVAAARTQGRRDWLFLAMGTLLTEIVSYALASDGVRHLFEVLVRGVQRIGTGT
jgi:hypothetical protein